MKMRLGLFLLSAVGAMVAAPTQACRVAGNQTPILRETLPVLEDGVIAAEVEIITDTQRHFAPMEARIIRMIKGDFEGKTLTIAPTIYSSCDGWPYSGSRGIVVGRVLSITDDKLVIDPIRGPSQFQLEREAAAAGTTGP